MTATHACPHPLVAGCDHDDQITITALEAEKSLPPEVVPRSGPLTFHAFALLDQDGNVVVSQEFAAPIAASGGDITFTDITFRAL